MGILEEQRKEGLEPLVQESGKLQQLENNNNEKRLVVL